MHVVDNGSTDGSIQYVTQRFPAAKVICFERNLGFAELYNRAVRSIGEELAVFLNNDVQVEEKWLIELPSRDQPISQSPGGWRAWLTGFRVLYVPSSRVYHKLGATMGPFLTPERLFLGEKNRIQSMLQNLECGNLAVAMFVSLVYSLSRLPTFPASRRHMVVLAVLQADLWVLRHLPKILVKRRQVQQQNRQISDSFLTRHGLMTSLIEGYREFIRIIPLRASSDRKRAGRNCLKLGKTEPISRGRWSAALNPGLQG